MKCRYSKISVILLLCMLLLNGCDSNSINNNGKGSTQQETAVPTPTESASDQEASNQQGQNGTDSAVGDPDTQSGGKQQDEAPPVMVDVPIYTIDNDTMDTKDTTGVVAQGTKITAQLIVTMVISALADSSYTVDVKEVITEDSNVIIDFNSLNPPIVDVSEDAEEAILDSFAKSILSNIADCEGVIFRAGGKAYQSQNNAFDYNQIYLTK